MQKTTDLQKASAKQQILDFAKKNVIVIVLILLCIGFAIGRVACNVWGAYVATLEEVAVDMRFMLPHVDNALGYEP